MASILLSKGDNALNVALKPVEGSVTGRVHDKGGNYLQGVKVALNGKSTLTDTMGFYMLTIIPGTYTLIFSKSGYESKSYTVTITESGISQSCYLEALYSLTVGGYVLDVNGVGVAGATVKLETYYGIRRSVGSAKTNSSGFYSITWKGVEDTYLITATLPPYSGYGGYFFASEGVINEINIAFRELYEEE